MKAILLHPFRDPIKSSVDIPGSKSYTNRSLVMATLTKGTVKILNPLWSDDTHAMINALQKLGVQIQKTDDCISVSGHTSDIRDSQYDIDCNLSGTTIRFLIALCCIIPGIQILYGKESLNKRPISDLVDGLRQAGASIEYMEKEGFPPVRILSSTLNKATITISGKTSSQYLTALFMISPAVGGLNITIDGEQISKSYIDMTIDMLKQWNIDVINHSYKRYIIPEGQEYSLNQYTVEGDYSAAGYFFAISALTNSTITLNNLNPQSKQGDVEFMHILRNMGNTIHIDTSSITITGKGITPITANLEKCPDQAQTMAVLAAFAKGTTKLTGVRSLRVKETERVKALQNELHKMHIKTESPDEDTLIIHGGNPQPATIDTYHDHRMAMSFAIAGTRIKGMKINNPEVVNKTFPSFWKWLKHIGVCVS